MPMREFGCDACMVMGELYHPAIDPVQVPLPSCPLCHKSMTLEMSAFNLDTSDNFSGKQVYSGPDGRVWNIDSLHKMRMVEKSYQETGHDVRFDAWSAEPSNPDAVDGFGLEYWDGSKTFTNKKKVVDLHG